MPSVDRREYHRQRQARLRKEDPERVKAAKRRWEKKNPEKVAASRRRYEIKRKYGITWDQYVQLLEAQSHACAICLRPEGAAHPVTGNVMSLAVDHDHVTGEVRGLLCRLCNVGISQLGESPETLRRAADYLSGSRAG